MVRPCLKNQWSMMPITRTALSYIKLLPYPEILNQGYIIALFPVFFLFGEFVRYATRQEKEIMGPLVFY